MAHSPSVVVIVGAGQSGLAAASAAKAAGFRPLILEAGERPVGSWPAYYDSLTLFSPARYSAFPGVPLPGDPDRYPSRDEVVAYLEAFAATLDVELRTGVRVVKVTTAGTGFAVHTESGEVVQAAGVVAASGSFGSPFVPSLPGLDGFTGDVLHVAGYRRPKSYAGQRVVVVGAGNSAVQVAYELADVATVTLAVRRPVQFIPQVRGGRDMHYWLTKLRIDLLPPAVLSRVIRGTPVFDTGEYRAALASGRYRQRPMFSGFDGDHVVWPDGERERADTVILATGYRPNVDYLEPLGALDTAGLPLHKGGVSLTHPGLVYAGLEFQRSFSSNTLRGVHRDATHVIAALKAHL
ncbi:NAD(P)/FAD-dependent oxidoreductase [Kribbella sp. NBC_01245]|uniref:flavin-containing monooxygenase n=1 Tax=Kribbella sp. NBC_01245 TaxID=2903578 RepID=UPI002E2B2D96|nr:NAD(P)/FAD-dependent oxidoreductase [Kribbella sp. NBC_01245]